MGKIFKYFFVVAINFVNQGFTKQQNEKNQYENCRETIEYIAFRQPMSRKKFIRILKATDNILASNINLKIVAK